MLGRCVFCRRATDAYRFQDAQGAEGVYVCGVFRGLETHRHMALCGKVVDLVGLYVLDYALQVAAVG